MTSNHARVAVIGAGFAGIGMSIALDRARIDHVIFERARSVGGTWRDNRYPGCACDVPTPLYSYSFALNPEWSRLYAPQEEILEYLERVAREFGVVDRIRFGHEVTDACWDEGSGLWVLETSRGRWTADAVVAATGPLAEPAEPDLPGLQRFEGARFHSSRWSRAATLDGSRAAVVGTGASAVQIIPRIEPLVSRLHVFQRTPAWVLPHPDRPIPRSSRLRYQRFPVLQRLARARIYWLLELLVLGFCKSPALMSVLRRIGEDHLERQVHDHELREKLRPRFAPGCKRLLLSNDYYRVLASPKVEVVTEPIREVRARAIVTADGAERPVDALILATGFRVTDNPVFEHIRGRDRISLACAWAGGMAAYKGTTVPGFPNLFILAGPNTGIGHTSLLFMIEAQYRYVVGALKAMDRLGLRSLEVRPEAVARFHAWLQRRLRRSVWMLGGCSSWYRDAQGRVPTMWPDFTWKFWLRTRVFDEKAYLRA